MKSQMAWPFILSIICQSAALAQGSTNLTPGAPPGVVAPGATPGSFSQASPLRQQRPWYPRQQIQNPSNPWLPPNLNQTNTSLQPVGSISPTGVLTQPTSVLNSPNTVQYPGQPTVPTYNLGTPSPVQAGATQPATTATLTTTPALVPNATNPANQSIGAAPASNPTNPLFP